MPSATEPFPQIFVTAVATPRMYEVREGDTFFDIAALNNITVAMLQAANPAVDPRLLTPGTQLVIPEPDTTVVPAIPSPTPAAVSTDPAQCYSSAAAELWCFLLVSNENDAPLENVIGVIQVLDDEGGVLATIDAMPMLNVLAPGESMPLVAYMRTSPGGWVGARGQVVSAYLVTDTDYYLQATLNETQIDISEAGIAAQITGHISTGATAPGTAWVLAVAYASDGAVVGVYRWERQQDDAFDFWVYSLGPKIATVDLLVEARP